MFRQRLLYGAVMIAGMVGIVVLDARLSQQAILKAAGALGSGGADLLSCALPITLLVVFLTVLAAYEMSQLCRAGGFKPAAHWAAIVSAGLVFIPWLESQKLTALITLPIQLHLWWLTGGLLGTCLALLLRKTTERALSNMALTMFIILYLGLLGSFAVRIRCMHQGAAGAALFVYVILTVKSSDIGAYFTGLLLGRHKLIPWLSPGKTIEGAVGAVVFAAATAAGGTLLWRSYPVLGTPPLQLAQALIFGAVMAVVGHLGDLTESAFKRDVGLKDSGHFMPAFGGLLDLLDSPLFAAPVAWFILTIWSPIR